MQALPTLAEVIARHYAAAVESAPALSREIDGQVAATELRAVPRRMVRARGGRRFAVRRLGERAMTLAQRALELTPEERRLLRARRLQLLAGATANTVGVDEAERAAPERPRPVPQRRPARTRRRRGRDWRRRGRRSAA